MSDDVGSLEHTHPPCRDDAFSAVVSSRLPTDGLFVTIIYTGVSFPWGWMHPACPGISMHRFSFGYSLLGNGYSDRCTIRLKPHITVLAEYTYRPQLNWIPLGGI